MASGRPRKDEQLPCPKPRVLTDESGAVITVVGAPCKRRERRHPSRYRYVRRVKGRSYQARVHVGPTRADAVNLGLFGERVWGTMAEAEWAAGRAAREFVKRYQPGADLWAVIESLKRDGLIPAHVLPRWVYALPGGGYGARVRKGGRLIHLRGPYPTPVEAHLAMARRLAAHLARLKGRG